jgi:hypothetical protein
MARAAFNEANTSVSPCARISPMNFKARALLSLSNNVQRLKHWYGASPGIVSAVGSGIRYNRRDSRLPVGVHLRDSRLAGRLGIRVPGAEQLRSQTG